MDAKAASGSIRAWLIVAMLFLFMVINFADKAVFGLAAVPMMRDLNLSPREFGLVGSSFFLLFSLSGIGFGFVANRVQSKWLLVLLAVIWSAVQFPLVAASVTLPVLIASRVLLGLGEGPAFPLAQHACYKWFDNARRNVPNTIVQQGASAGLMLAGPILSYLIVRYDWHMAFLALGIVGLVWTALWLVIGRDGPVGAASHAAGVPHDGAGEIIAYRHLLLNRTFMGVLFIYFVEYAVISLAFTWFPVYLRLGLGFAPIVTGWLFSTIVGSFIPVTLLLAWVSQRLIRKGVSSRLARGVLVSGFAMLGGVLFLATSSGLSPALKVACLAIGGALSQLVFSFGPLMISDIVSVRQRGALLGINSSIGTLAGLIAPALMGGIVQANQGNPALGYEHGFIVVGALLLVSGALGLVLLNPEQSRQRILDAARRDAAQASVDEGAQQRAIASSMDLGRQR
ncbi:MFS transporter [Paraburkholderia unamae]|uniref:Sugar phosphate permease n=1 Tax=Paraburkholderia unamae TaxID=219649 RepID=A0ABX5KBZ8_9BURK|nr:MFS transporter [Paraburkholderia unamae]PVX73561.1 sugar phosphate permease [Paraburkholderia unamae]RAR56235.1 sugar phosphate permease [Paraburkholderia unamae]